MAGGAEPDGRGPSRARARDDRSSLSLPSEPERTGQRRRAFRRRSAAVRLRPSVWFSRARVVWRGGRRYAGAPPRSKPPLRALSEVVMTFSWIAEPKIITPPSLRSHHLSSTRRTAPHTCARARTAHCLASPRLAGSLASFASPACVRASLAPRRRFAASSERRARFVFSSSSSQRGRDRHVLGARLAARAQGLERRAHARRDRRADFLPHTLQEARGALFNSRIWKKKWFDFENSGGTFPLKHRGSEPQLQEFNRETGDRRLSRAGGECSRDVSKREAARGWGGGRGGGGRPRESVELPSLCDGGKGGARPRATRTTRASRHRRARRARRARLRNGALLAVGGARARETNAGGASATRVGLEAT